MADAPPSSVPRVVIIGAGFGGLQAAKRLANQPVKVTLVDRKNHHTFQPLLYQVATAGLSAGEIAAPVRHILRHARNVDVLLAEVTGIDLAARQRNPMGRRSSRIPSGPSAGSLDRPLGPGTALARPEPAGPPRGIRRR